MLLAARGITHTQQGCIRICAHVQVGSVYVQLCGGTTTISSVSSVRQYTGSPHRLSTPVASTMRSLCRGSQQVDTIIDVLTIPKFGGRSTRLGVGAWPWGCGAIALNGHSHCESVRVIFAFSDQKSCTYYLRHVTFAFYSKHHVLYYLRQLKVGTPPIKLAA